MKLALATKICNMHEGQLEAALRIGEGFNDPSHFIEEILEADIRELDARFTVKMVDDGSFELDEHRVVMVFVSEENGQIVGKY